MIVGVFGRRGMGKSTVGKFIADRVAPKRIAFDVRNQFPIDGAALVTFDPEEPDLFGYLDDDAIDTIIVRPAGQLQEGSDRLAAEVSSYLGASPDARLSVILDDAGNIPTLEAWNRLFRTADRDRVWFILTVHRPVDLTTDVRALMNWWVVFRTTQKSDLDAIRARCGDEFAERVRTLGPREFWVWNDDTIDESKQMTFFGDPDAWRVPLDRPTVAHA